MLLKQDKFLKWTFICEYVSPDCNRTGRWREGVRWGDIKHFIKYNYVCSQISIILEIETFLS